MDNYLDFDFDLIMNDLEETYIDYDYELNEYNKYINARQIIVYIPIDVNLIILYRLFFSVSLILNLNFKNYQLHKFNWRYQLK